MKIKMFLFCVALCCYKTNYAQTNWAKYVNPFIGTGGTGHTFPGAVLPFGMVQLSPDTKVDGSWEGCSGYHYNDSVIYGFSHTHLSGTGCSDYGDIMLMPYQHSITHTQSEYASTFHHQNEHAEAGYYKVKLNNGTLVELTTTNRVGFHQYTFSKNQQAQVILDLTHRDELIDGDIKVLNSTTLSGFRRSKAWASNQIIYYHIEFSEPIIQTDFRFQKLNQQKPQSVVCSFNLNKQKKLLIKVGISMVSQEGAALNMKTEVPHWNFNLIKQNASETWNKELSKIKIEDTTNNSLTLFYSALYHCFIHPSLASDVDGKYLGRDGKIHHISKGEYYTVFSLWDTFRALHPLFNLIQPERNQSFIRTFLLQYEQAGRLPMWELSSNETNCMIGYHAVSIIADAYTKGNRDFNLTLAAEACLKETQANRFGIETFNQNQFLEVGDESESVSKTLEYAYNNWCVAQLVENPIQQTHLINSANGWQNLFNPLTGFMQPRLNGCFMEPFAANEVNNHYTEANAWQYSFFVPHDVNTLISLHGGPINFEKKLDELFTTSSQTTGRTQADITGLIGQYAHGNEPSHHMIFLYNYINKTEKAEKLANKILTELYQNAPDGLSGNEDCGQMSAWYVCAALGFYPVCPGKNEYALIKPKFKQVTMMGKKFNNYMLPGIKLFNPNQKNNYTPAPLILPANKNFTDSLICTIKPLYTSGKTCATFNNKANDIVNIQNQITINQSLQLLAFNCENPIVKSVANFFKKPNNYSVVWINKPNKQYTANGPDGLVDGVYGDAEWRKGNWQGYQLNSLKAIIDLKTETVIDTITASFLQDTRSWILMPTLFSVSTSTDGINFQKPTLLPINIEPNTDSSFVKRFTIVLPKTQAKYIKVEAETAGNLPDWHVGKGNPAFIFVDEIEIKSHQQ